MNRYAEAHQAWLDKHLAARKGERRSRLERGHGHAERLFAARIWWPLMGSFDEIAPLFRRFHGNPDDVK